MTATTQPHLSADEVAVLRALCDTVSGPIQGTTVQSKDEAFAVIQRLLDLDLLIAYPSGERYMLSERGREVAASLHDNRPRNDGAEE